MPFRIIFGPTQSELAARQANKRAEQLRPVFAELAGLSAHQAAAELNRRQIASATGGKWYPMTVIRLREQLDGKHAPISSGGATGTKISRCRLIGS